MKLTKFPPQRKINDKLLQRKRFFAILTNKLGHVRRRSVTSTHARPDIYAYATSLRKLGDIMRRKRSISHVCFDMICSTSTKSCFSHRRRVALAAIIVSDWPVDNAMIAL